jgi:hypothetical protein
MVTIDIPIKDSKKPPTLKFPTQCVHCGASTSKTMPVKLNTGVQKRGQMIQLKMNVPLCAECTAKEHRIGNLTWLPFFVVGVLTCAIVFVSVWLIAPEGPTLQTAEFPYLLGAFVGMIAGVIAGTLVEFLLRMLFTPTYGKLLSKRPFTILSIFNDSEDLIGLSTRFSKERKILNITFENDDVARQFIALNPQEN